MIVSKKTATRLTSSSAGPQSGTKMQGGSQNQIRMTSATMPTLVSITRSGRIIRPRKARDTFVWPTLQAASCGFRVLTRLTDRCDLEVQAFACSLGWQFPGRKGPVQRPTSTRASPLLQRLAFEAGKPIAAQTRR